MFSSTTKALVTRFKTTRPTSNFSRWERDTYNQLVQETDFLPDNSPITQRLWHVEHNTNILPVCHVCNANPVTWNREKAEYREFCSTECIGRSEEVASKRSATMLERYGVEHYTTHSQFNDKRTETNRQRYGKDWATQTTDVQNKIALTNIERYGHPVYTQTDDYKKKHTATLTKLGVASTSQLRISPESLALLNDKEWLTNQHHVEKNTITSIAHSLNVDTTTVVNRCVKLGIELKRFTGSQGQKDIADYLRSIGVDNIVENDRSIINRHELDIYIPSLKLAVEYCGLYWHSPDCHARMTRTTHKEKLDMCAKVGIRLITIFEDEWLESQSIVKRMLSNACRKTTDVKINARQCNIRDVPTQQAANFLSDHHIQGDGDGNIKVGLFNGDDLVAVCKLIKRADRLVLNRYATSAAVRGGFTKLLTHVRQQYPSLPIETFADLRWGNGNLYGLSGFRVDKYIPPDYQYVKGNRRYHKFNFRKNRLQKLLDDYNPTETEVTNCLRHGMFRVWDCGKIKFVLD